jgi:hypothetical protein
LWLVKRKRIRGDRKKGKKKLKKSLTGIKKQLHLHLFLRKENCEIEICSDTRYICRDYGRDLAGDFG